MYQIMTDELTNSTLDGSAKDSDSSVEPQQPQKPAKVSTLHAKAYTPLEAQQDWPLIWASASMLLPESKDTAKQQLLLKNALSNGSMVCWKLWTQRNDKRMFVGVALTRLIQDEFFDTRSCLIYGLTSSNFVTNEAWHEAFAALEAYARENNCTDILFCSKHPRVLRLVKELGFDTSERIGRKAV